MASAVSRWVDTGQDVNTAQTQGRPSVRAGKPLPPEGTGGFAGSLAKNRGGQPARSWAKCWRDPRGRAPRTISPLSVGRSRDWWNRQLL